MGAWMWHDVMLLMSPGSDGRGPARLVTDAPASPPDLFWLVVVGFGLLAVAAGLVAALLWRSRRLSSDPAGYAFVKLSRAMRLRRRDRRTLCRLAEVAGHPRASSPVGLLLSVQALERAIGACSASGEQSDAMPDRASIDRVRRLLGP